MQSILVKSGCKVLVQLANLVYADTGMTNLANPHFFEKIHY